MSRKNFRIPISVELLLLSVVPLVIIAVLSSALFINISNKNVQSTVLELSKTTTEKLGVEVDALLDKYYEKVNNLSEIIPVLYVPEELQIISESLSKDLTEDFSIYFATEISRFEEGGFYIDSARWEPPADWNPPQRDWYIVAKSNPGKVVLTNPYVDSMTNNLCVTISRSVSSPSGTSLGVVAADLILNNLTDMVQDYKVSNNGVCYMIDRDGNYLTNSDASKVMAANFFEDYNISSDTVESEHFMDGDSHSFFDGENYVSISSIAETPWYVVAEGPISDFSQNLTEATNVIFIIIAILVFTVLVVALWFSRLISKTFKSMVGHCDKFSQGDFTANFGDYFISEAEDLARGFEGFSQNIRMLVGKIFQSTGSVSEISTALDSTSKSINSSISETVAAISQMGVSSNNQTNAVQQVDQAVNIIVSETDRLGREIDAQNQIISYSSASIEEIVQSMSSVQKRISEAASHVEEVVQLATGNKNALTVATQDIVNVRKESASLQEMNSVISSVAAQTNLLAMNAAIEAAHAGAAGKGFAVVADEIRKLAETASKQANSSSAYLKSIQGKIDGIAETAVNIDQSFAGTIQRINEISHVVTQLEQATSEQEMLSEQVLRALSDIQSSTENITANVGGITTSTSETSLLCHKLRSLNEDVNIGIQACKNASEEMQNAAELIGDVAVSAKDAVTDLLDAVSSFQVERRSNKGDRRKDSNPPPDGRERRQRTDRRKNNISLVPPTMSKGDV